jgi:deoxycytidylate deaminase
MKEIRDRVKTLGFSGWKFVLPVALLWVLFASATAQSATLRQTFIIAPGYNDSPNTTGNIGNEGPFYWGLDVAAGSDVDLTVAVNKALPANQAHTVNYTLEKVSSLADFVNDTGTKTFITSGVNGLTSLLLAGMDYVLTIDCRTCSNVQMDITANGVSAVPLPAAAWLFGSALVGFIMMSNRRSV